MTPADFPWPAWAALAVAAIILGLVAMFRADAAAKLIRAARGGGAEPDSLPVNIVQFSPEPEMEPNYPAGHGIGAGELPDIELWRALDIVASALSGAMIGIDYGGAIRVYNRAAEDMTGYKFNAVIGRDIGVLMGPADAATHQAFVDNYLKRLRDDATPQLVAAPRAITLRRADEKLVEVKARITHFGNGGGGFLAELLEQRWGE